MFLNKIKFLLFIIIFYQTPLYSKNNNFENFNSRNLSSYFSGIVAFENKNNTKALNFFNSSRVLVTKHDPYLKRYIYSLVLENKVFQAIQVIKSNKGRENSTFFEAYLLLILDSLRKNDLEKSTVYLKKISNFTQQDKLNIAVLSILKQYNYVFKKKKILKNQKDLGKLSIISETFQKCYLGDVDADNYFSKLINDNEGDYTRYIFFYLSYLIENKRFDKAIEITKNLDYINTTLLLSQGKNWVENKKNNKFGDFFSCKNSNDVIGEFLFLISNLYSSQDNFEKSNFYLNLSNFLNPKFIFNLSLTAENQYINGEYDKAKKTLKNFKKEDHFYYWYRVKKEAQIIEKQKNKKESLNYIKKEFDKIIEPNNKNLFDIANFYKNSKKYESAIKYYTKIIDNFNDTSQIKSDLLYRRGGSYERLGNYKKADEDLLLALKINPNDAYILNYLAYSWLERNYKIKEAIEMLETAYSYKNNDPYIIDSIGWAYYLIKDYLKAERYLLRAVKLMPDDPIVNDHYGDILWKLNRKIQARYFWKNVLKMKDVENEMIKNIDNKIIYGLNES